MSAVPDYPADNAWVSVLHWCVCVMDASDPDLAFVASVLSHAIKFGGLTEKQVKYAARTADRLYALWTLEELPAQIRNRLARSDAAPALDSGSTKH